MLGFWACERQRGALRVHTHMNTKNKHKKNPKSQTNLQNAAVMCSSREIMNIRKSMKPWPLAG